jgi:hypothetical protein
MPTMAGIVSGMYPQNCINLTNLENDAKILHPILQSAAWQTHFWAVAPISNRLKSMELFLHEMEIRNTEYISEFCKVLAFFRASAQFAKDKWEDLPKGRSHEAILAQNQTFVLRSTVANSEKCKYRHCSQSHLKKLYVVCYNDTKPGFQFCEEHYMEHEFATYWRSPVPDEELNKIKPSFVEKIIQLEISKEQEKIEQNYEKFCKRYNIQILDFDFF